MMRWLEKIIGRGYYLNERIKQVKGAFYNSIDIAEGEWIKIVPVGDFPNHPDGPHRITPEHIRQMETNFSSTKKELLFDYEHRSLWGDSLAAGWSAEVKAQPDGLYAKYPNYTPAAKDKVANREYRYFSPVYFMRAKDRLGRDIGAKIDSVALTNIPYMENEIDHIKNDSLENMMKKELLAKLGLPETATQAQYDERVAALRTELKLDAGATAEQVASAAAKRAEGDGAMVPAGNGGNPPVVPALTQADVDRQVAAAFQTRDAEQMVEAAVNSGKILPGQKDIYLNSAKADFAKTKAALEAIKPNATLPNGLGTPASGPEGDAKKNSLKAAADYFRTQGRAPVLKNTK